MRFGVNESPSVLPQQLLQAFQQLCIFIGHHKAEPEEGLIFHSEKCGAVSEHQSFFDGMDKYIIRGHALLENFHQNEICIRFVNFHGFPGQQLLIDPFTLGGD